MYIDLIVHVPRMINHGSYLFWHVPRMLAQIWIWRRQHRKQQAVDSELPLLTVRLLGGWDHWSYFTGGKLKSPVLSITDAYVMTMATHVSMLAMFGHRNLIWSLASYSAVAKSDLPAVWTWLYSSGHLWEFFVYLRAGCHCYWWGRRSFRGFFYLQCCLDGWCVTHGFAADHCFVTRWSMFFTSPVSPYIMADRCILLA